MSQSHAKFKGFQLERLPGASDCNFADKEAHESQAVLIHRAIIIADSSSDKLVLTRIRGQKVRAHHQLASWSPRSQYTFAGSGEYLAFVGGLKLGQSICSKKLQVIEPLALATGEQTLTNLKLLKARRRPAVAFSPAHYNLMVVYGGYSSDGSFEPTAEVFDLAEGQLLHFV